MKIFNKINKKDVDFLFLFNYKMQRRLLTKFMRTITLFGSLVFTVAIAIIFLFADLQKGLFLVLNLVISQIIVHTLKRLVHRQRPYRKHGWTKTFSPPAKDYSLPSGHSASSLTMALVIGYFIPVIKIPLYIIAAITGLSRIYLGCHYPTDVILGMLISILVYFSTLPILPIF